jgi:Tol biopolymer transport system component
MIRCRPSRTLLLAVFTIVVAAPGLAACGSSPSPAPTVTVTVSPSSSASPSSSPTATKPAVKKQLAIAVASGSAANGVSVIGSAGQVKQLVAPHGGPIRDLAWSPDGTRLAYVQAKSVSVFAGRLWVYDTSTGKASQIIFPNEDQEAVADGFTWVGATQLVVSVIGSGPPYRANGAMWVIDVAKHTQKTMKDTAGHIVLGASPTASADGMLVAFVHYSKVTGGKIPEKLLLYDADTLAVSEVAHGEAYADIDSDAFSFPSLSPDGSLVYTCQTGSDPGFRCTVYRVDGSKAYVSPPLIWPTDGAWDAKGTRLAFGGLNSAAYSGYTSGDVINVWLAGSSKASTILHYGRPDAWLGSLAWTPLGKQIVYTVPLASGSNGDIWVVNADGTNKHKLLHNGSHPACAEAPIKFP